MNKPWFWVACIAVAFFSMSMCDAYKQRKITAPVEERKATAKAPEISAAQRCAYTCSDAKLVVSKFSPYPWVCECRSAR